MNKFKTGRVALFLTLLLTLFVTSVSAEIPSPTDRFFVNDYADIIDAQTENYIFETGKAYNNGGGPQIAVLTVNSIGNESVEEFSIKTAREWGLGSKDADNGVLITLVLDSRDIRIEVGYGLEGVLNDGKCGRFIRNATPMLSSGDYSGGLKQIYDDIIGELEAPTPDEEDDDLGAGEIIAIIMLIIFWLMIFGFRGRRRRFWGGPRGGFGGFGGSSGGGFSGGGFSGGGFSGGGGGFGGGGASGKF